MNTALQLFILAKLNKLRVKRERKFALIFPLVDLAWVKLDLMKLQKSAKHSSLGLPFCLIVR